MPGGTHTRSAGLLQVAYLVFEQDFGPLHHTREDAHAIDERATAGGIIDHGLYAGRIQPQLPSFGGFCLPCQLDHPVVKGMYGLRSRGLLPAEQRTGVG